MKIFVTGGAGFIGSHLVDRLLKQENEVTVFDSLRTGRKASVEQYTGKQGFEFVEGDMLDTKKLQQVIKGHELVYHLAANADIRQGMQNPKIDLDQNLIATYNLLDAMRINDIKQIVFSSSSGVYGEPEKIPTPENYFPLTPYSLYGASKLGAEAYISAFCHTYTMKGWIFRFVNTIGKYNTHGVIGDFIRKLKDNPRELEILGNGKQLKSYMHINDCLDAVQLIYEKAREKVNIYNVGNEDWVNVDKVADIICEVMGLEDVKYKHTSNEPRGWVGDAPKVLLDITRIKKLGWKPKLNSEQAVRKATKDMIESWIEDRYNSGYQMKNDDQKD